MTASTREPRQTNNATKTQVRSYFGEKIAFYYLFLAHATTYFSYAAVIGFAVFLNTLISPEAENAASVPYFCAFMGLWATFFIETWKRKESRHAMEWGTIGFEDVERDRPEYAEGRFGHLHRRHSL